MKKVILIDGNNILFRSYYATAYTGNMMKNSKGFPTNALLGFSNMINKIIREEEPSYIVVAFDKGKTFRHVAYESYKENRIEMPDELRKQFPVAKEILDAMGIKYLEIDNYEADDIIGTVSKMIDDNNYYIGTIISSDKDLLQLISNDIEVKLLKQQDYILYDEEKFKKEYGLDPIKIIDLKGLQGDPSDNIPGVKGIGEKTALKLIQEYGSIEGIYANIDSVKGKLKEKLLEERDNAFMSKTLATIHKEVPINTTLDDIKYEGPKISKLMKLYEELEFYSLIKKIDTKVPTIKNKDVKIIRNINDIKIDKDSALYLEIFGSNYHTAKVLGIAVYNDNLSCYIPFEVLMQNPNILNDNIKYTYDLKKVIVSLKWNNINIEHLKIDYDLMIASYLLNYNIKDDISYLANQFNYDIPFYEISYGKDNKFKDISEKEIASICVEKAKFIYETHNRFITELEKENMLDLFNDIEMPLVKVLADMEYTGININVKTLDEIGTKLTIKLEELTNNIHNKSGTIFNIASPKQLGEVLFEQMGLPYPKKSKKTYSTDRDTLLKIKDEHPIISDILEYRTLTKIYSSYVEGLKNNILSDGKIHTIFNQTLTRTGRLSSIEPNLQNIPIRMEEGRIIRKAFESTAGSSLMTSDYSQIELRILAHISEAQNLIDAFNNGMDIHNKTAMDIFDVKEEDVTKDMRRKAKAVNFGIVYGISSFGLSENLDINPKEAELFIDKYLNTYPSVKAYMDKVVKQAYEDGYVTTIMNRKRVIDELKNTNYTIRKQGERMALNTPIQGSSADIIKKAMIDIFEEFRKQNLKSKMLIQVHDELVFDVIDSEKHIVTNIVAEKMENAYKLSVPLKVDINFGLDWYEAK